MSYHVMTSSRSAGFRPLTAAMRVRSVGSIYTEESSVISAYSEEGLEPPSLESEFADVAESFQDFDASDQSSEPVDEEEKRKKTLMIAGGIGAVVLVAGIAVVAIRK